MSSDKQMKPRGTCHTQLVMMDLGGSFEAVVGKGQVETHTRESEDELHYMKKLSETPMIDVAIQLVSAKKIPDCCPRSS